MDHQPSQGSYHVTRLILSKNPNQHELNTSGIQPLGDLFIL